MIRKSWEMRKELRENMVGGTGSVRLTHLLEGDELLGKSRLCAVLTFGPGDSIGPHSHVKDAEIYYMLQGELTLLHDGAETVIRSGDVVFTANGEGHSVENRTHARAELLAVVLL